MADGGGIGASLGSSAGGLDDLFAGNTMGNVSVIPGLTADASTGAGIGDPFGGNTMDAGNSWWDRLGAWGDKHGSQLAGGLGGAGKSVGDVNKSQRSPMPSMGQGGGGAGISRGQGPNLNQLVQLLMQRQQGLYPGGGSSGQPQPAARTQGLLGF